MPPECHESVGENGPKTDHFCRIREKKVRKPLVLSGVTRPKITADTPATLWRHSNDTLETLHLRCNRVNSTKHGMVLDETLSQFPGHCRGLFKGNHPESRVLKTGNAAKPSQKCPKTTKVILTLPKQKSHQISLNVAKIQRRLIGPIDLDVSTNG